MKATRFLALLLCGILLLGALPALAAQNNFYIIPDSDSRYLTEAELWDWQYDALGYIYNEIFARHGRSFRTGEKYDRYFRNQAWYQVNPNYRYGLLNTVEIANQQLAHAVLQDMRAQKTTNPRGKPLPISNDDANLMTSFSFGSYSLIGGQKLAVYSGPGTDYYRAANGRATVSTNGNVRIAGVENGWLLIEYETSGGSRRVGYVYAGDLRDRLNVSTLDFYSEAGTITASRCYLTDDPNGNQQAECTLVSGDYVTLLGQYAGNRKAVWWYVEVFTQEGTMRGFIPVNSAVGTGNVGTGSYDWTDEPTAQEDNG